jgi:hypothetical protein
MKNPFIPSKETSKVKFIDLPHSAGILDDFAVRKNIATKEGSIEHTPTADKHIVNKEYVDNSYFIQGVRLSNVKFVRAFGANMPVGNNVLYTVPAGKKALLFNTSTRFHNNNAVSMVGHKPAILSGGVYYPISTWGNATVGQYSLASGTSFCLEAGESMVEVIDGANGFTVGYILMEFDDTAPMRTVRVENLALGNNTIYTCPAGKTATGVSSTWRETAPATSLANYSGASRTYIPYFVPNGLAADATTQMLAATALSDKTITNYTCSSNMEEGDSIVINTNNGTAGQFSWMTIIELDV